MKPPPWHAIQQQIMRAVGENPGAFRRSHDAEAEHQRQQADAEARAERWERAKDDEAMETLMKKSREKACVITEGRFLL